MLVNDNTGHRQRLRDRFNKVGIDGLCTHEVLELLLFYIMPRRDVKPLAKSMLKEFGSLANLFESKADAIVTRTGVTENTATFLSFISQLTRRYQLDKYADRIKLKDLKVVTEYAKALCSDLHYEHFFVMFLDNSDNLLAVDRIAEGGLTGVNPYMRNIMDRAIVYKCAKVVLVHNHPSAKPKPSQADVDTTQEIMRLLGGLDVEVVDHIIVVGKDTFSFEKAGILNEIIREFARIADREREARKGFLEQ